MPHICPYMKTCPTYVQTGRPRTIGIMRIYTHVHTESSFDYRTICPICVLTCPICVLNCPICVPYVSTYVHRRLHREQFRLPHDMSHICPLICPKCVLICPICVHRRLHREQFWLPHAIRRQLWRQKFAKVLYICPNLSHICPNISPICVLICPIT